MKIISSLTFIVIFLSGFTNITQAAPSCANNIKPVKTDAGGYFVYKCPKHSSASTTSSVSTVNTGPKGLAGIDIENDSTKDWYPAPMNGFHGYMHKETWRARDFNNDGWPDLFIPKYEFNSGVKSRVYINNQDGTFRDISDFAGMSSQGDMGHNTSDVNADGYPDILIGTGHPFQVRNDLVKTMFPVLNSDSMKSHEAARFMGLDSVGLSRSHGYALGDIDNDGDVDIYNNNGGPSQIQTSWGYNAFYFAEGNTSNWMKMSLTGVVSNRDAIGARVMVEGTDDREIWRYPAVGKGFCNTDSPILHFGLGNAVGTKLTEIYWPSTLVQTYVNLDTQKQYDIVETGIRITGTPVAGGQMMIRVSGVPGGLATSFYSLASAFLPDPVEHVVHRLGGNPIQGPSATITDQGGVNIPFTIPASATSGTSFFIQVTVTDPRYPNGIHLKTNAVELVVT